MIDLSKVEFQEIERLMLSILECKTQAHRRIVIGMILDFLADHWKIKVKK